MASNRSFLWSRRTLLGEPGPPATHRVRINPEASRDLLIRHTVGRQQQSTGLHNLAMRNPSEGIKNPKRRRHERVLEPP